MRAYERGIEGGGMEMIIMSLWAVQWYNHIRYLINAHPDPASGVRGWLRETSFRNRPVLRQSQVCGRSHHPQTQR